MECRWTSPVAVPGVLLLLLLIGAVAPLKDVHVVIPKAVRRGEDATLKCEYDLEGERLYQLKWYKGQDEFFRYTPGEGEAPFKVFGLKGINVDRERSSRWHVTLHKVNMSAEGRYACEVSADAPSFSTSLVEDRLIVVEVPRKGPKITGVLETRYRIGERLRANCSSEASHPPANLTISINGQQYVPHELVRDYTVKKENGIGKRRVIGVEITLQPEHFGPDNKLKIRCSAIIFDVYNMVDEKTVEVRLPNLWAPNVMETNQPPREPPYDQDPYGDFDHKRPRYPDDDNSAGRSSVSACLTALALLVATVVLR